MNVLEKILEEIKARKEEWDKVVPTEYENNVCQGIEIAEEIIEEHLEYNSWIPVTEKLPEDIDYVLVTVNGEYEWGKFENAIMIGNYDFRSNDWIIEGLEVWENPNVTAWMLLPEPYKGE